MRLTEARLVLTESVLHVGSDTYSPEKKDRAIKYACKRFIIETNASVELADFSIKAGDLLVDIALKEGLDDFERSQFFWAHLTTEQTELRLVPYRSLIRRQTAQGKEGQPTHISFADQTNAFFFPTPAKDYTVRMERRRPLVTWESGTEDPGDVDLNIPGDYIEQVLWTGAKWALIGGAPGHPDSAAAGVQFEKLIEQAKTEFLRGDPGLNDRISAPGMKLPQWEAGRARRG